jgi:hypothetical protein
MLKSCSSRRRSLSVTVPSSSVFSVPALAGQPGKSRQRHRPRLADWENPYFSAIIVARRECVASLRNEAEIALAVGNEIEVTLRRGQFLPTSHSQQRSQRAIRAISRLRTCHCSATAD